MNTLYLKYVLEIEKAGSISQAAQNLFMAQPNLSKAIKDLEHELGYSIFKRTSSGVTVTERGNEFLFHARKMAEHISEIEKISKRADSDSMQFKISIPRGSYIASGVTAFVAELPIASGLDITVNETNTLRTISNVADRGYNMGIIRYNVEDEAVFHSRLKNNKLESETLWEFQYVLVMSREHPLAGKSRIYTEDLQDYIKITHADIEDQHEQDKKGARESGKPEKTIYVYERGSQFDLLANVSTTYMWVSPIPESVLEKNGLVQRVCADQDNRYKDVLIYRQDYKLGNFDKLFQKKIYESKVDVAAAKYE